MTKTIDLEELKSFTNAESGIVAGSDMYYHFTINLRPSGAIEASDEEILSLPEKLGVFSFLDNSEEDIYSTSDGSPLA